MSKPPLPKNEESRLASLLECQMLDTASEKIFDYVTYLATELCNVSIAMVVFIDKDRQWFKSKYGVPQEFKDITETPRNIAFCAYTILGDSILEVTDLTQDVRFNDNPFVTDFPSIRYYAGIPLVTEGGNIGTLCLLDSNVRPSLSEKEKKFLQYLSEIVLTLIDLKKSLAHTTFLGEALDRSFNQVYFFDYQTLACIYWNKSAAESLGFKHNPADQLFFSNIFMGVSLDALRVLFEPLVKKQKDRVVFECMGRKHNADIVPLELMAHIVFSKSKPVLIVIANDITQRKLKEEIILSLNKDLKSRVVDSTLDANKSLALVNATLQATTDAILVVDNEGHVTHSNERYLEYFGLHALDKNRPWFGAIVNKMVSPENFLLNISRLKEALHQKSYDELVFKDGQTYDCYSQPQVVNNEITGRVWCFRDISTQKLLQNELKHQATHDVLTGISNRLLLEDRISQAIAYSSESGHLFAIVFVDLDRFKQINDTYSHHIGDELLKEVARRLKDTVRSSDSIARIGGDEFVVLLSPIKKEDEISAICQKIQDKIAEKYVIEGQPIYITASIGVSLFPRDSNNVETLLYQADVAMFRAKELGNHAFQYYTEALNARASKTMQLETYLNSAIYNNELMLNYQPLLNLETGQLFGVEALVRWYHPKLGLVPPLDFIPIAEATGKILPIGDWILFTACQQLMVWHKEFPTLRMAVNISAQQFIQEDFLSSVYAVFEKTQVDPAFIDFELTETLLLENLDLISVKMQALRDLGITLVIDDFGTGYSSLRYLKGLPIGKLKIDRSFVQSIEHDQKDIAIVLAIITMAKSLGLKILVEGVEHLNQFNFFIEHDCDELQGYIVSKALDAEQCYAFFKEFQVYNFKEGFLNNLKKQE